MTRQEIHIRVQCLNDIHDEIDKQIKDAKEMTDANECRKALGMLKAQEIILRRIQKLLDKLPGEVTE